MDLHCRFLNKDCSGAEVYIPLNQPTVALFRMIDNWSELRHLDIGPPTLSYVLLLVHGQ
jgi:hypothetical protein